MKKSEFFISYCRRDIDFASALFSELSSRGKSVWYDQNMTAGEEWRDSIYQAIQSAEVMLVLISSSALHSKEMKKEIAVARQEGIPMIAIRIEDVKLSGAFAYELISVNWIDWFDIKSVGGVVDNLSNKAIAGHDFSNQRNKLSFGSMFLFVVFVFVTLLQTLLYQYWVDEPAIGGYVNSIWLVFLISSVGSPAILVNELAYFDGLLSFLFVFLSLVNTLVLFVFLWRLLSFFNRRH